MAQAQISAVFYEMLNSQNFALKEATDGPSNKSEKDIKICPIKTCKKEITKSNFFR